jgi:lipoyl-dependent peroxiredoxin subunit D
MKSIIEKMPEYAKDIKLNLQSVMKPSEFLSDKQIAGLALVSALASRNKEVIEAARRNATLVLNDAETRGVMAAFAVMSMNNIYYRSLHLLEDKSYSQMPAGLRMTLMMSHGINPADFELFELAVSAINGCGNCLNGHDHGLKKQNVPPQTIQAALKIAAVVFAASVILENN